MKSHYETLGVPNNASLQQIKVAWRKLSAKAHPDRKGGSHKEQQQLNDAYNVLSDPDRRAHYDQTGSSEPRESPERILENLFMQFVTEVIEALMNEPGANPVRLMHLKIDAAEEGLRKTIDELKAREKQLERQIRRVRRKKEGALNLFVQVLEHQRAGCADKLKSLPILLEQVRALRPMVKDYEFVPDPPIQEVGGRTLFSFGSGIYR